MTGPDNGPAAIRPVSVAELLAKNGTIGSPPVGGGRRRRRRSNSRAVTVADLTGEIPVVSMNDEFDLADDDEEAESEPCTALADDGAAPVGDADEAQERAPRQEAYQQREPAEVAVPDELGVADGNCLLADTGGDDALFSGQTPADELARGTDYPGPDDDEPVAGDSSYQVVDEPDAEALDGGDLTGGYEEDYSEHYADDYDYDADDYDADYDRPSRGRMILRGLATVLQSILAVAFGAGLFMAFDQLWKWNSLVAMVLAVLATLGLVAGVWVVRKTEDIASTLIAVGVGLLVTFGPLALMHAT